MIRLAIIGAGWAGERQIQAIRELDGEIAVECLVDSDEAFLSAKAVELNISKLYTRLEDALADPNVDAVSICTPHHLHCPMALAAAAAKKHVLVEKPIAMTVEDATRMIDAADANGVKLYVAENLSYTPQAAFLRDLVQTGDNIGEVAAASLVWGFRAPNFGYPGRRAWLTQPAMGGTGTWMLHGIHTMAQLRSIFGEVNTIYLCERHAPSFQRADLEGTMSGVLTLESGLHITLIQTCETRMVDPLGGYTVYGSTASVRAFAGGYEIIRDEGEIRRCLYPEFEWSEYALEIQAFADYVLHNIEGLTTGRSERRSLAIVQAGYESMQQKKPINLTERFGVLS